MDDSIQIFVNDNRPNNEHHYLANFKFDPNSAVISNGNSHHILIGFSGSGVEIFSLLVGNMNNQFAVFIAAFDDSGYPYLGTFVEISDAPHLLEVEWRAASAPGSNNGSFILRVDGVQRASLNGIDNDTRRLEQVRLGAAGSIGTTRGTYYFDDFQSWGANGAQPLPSQTPTPAPSQTPTPTHTPTPMPTSGPVTTNPDWHNVPYDPFTNLVPNSVVPNPVLTAGDVTDIQATFVADPFLFYENNQWYMFFEVYDIAGRGHIGLARSSDGYHWTYDRLVLSESFHLSYPYVFKANGRYYMIPETFQSNSVRLYEAQNFPYSWNYVATLVSGRPYVDPSIFYHDGFWWMFVSTTSNSECYLFYSNNLSGGWREHPRSPIINNDASKARLGGRAFVYDTNKIIRTVQKDDVVYGESVRIFQVDTLTQTEYAEHEIAQSPILQRSFSGWNATAMHQFDPVWTGLDWIAVVDGANSAGVWSIGIYNVLRPSAPNGVIDLPAADLTITAGDTVNFAGSASDPGNNFPLSYLWQFGAGSGIPDATVEDPGLVQFNQPGVFTVRFTVTDATGLSDPTPATRTIIVRSGSPLIPQGGWSLTYVDSQETLGEDGRAVNAFDGSAATIWHTQWMNGSPPPPHEIRIDLGGSYSIDGFRYLPRQDGGVNGTIADYEFYISTDGVNWGLPVVSGRFASNTSQKEVYFPAVTGRYIRLRALSEINGNPWTTAAEINVTGN